MGLIDAPDYLTAFVSQIAGSYADSTKIRIDVGVHEVSLDLARATTAGLIIDELVTNSFKCAFPAGFDCMSVRGEPCSIRISLYPDAGHTCSV
jgi:two-component sensor histidine kinase